MTHTNQRTPTPMPSQKLASALNEFLHQSRDNAQTPHATQPAEVTDEQIAACVKRASTYGLPFVGLLNPGGTPSDFSKRFTAEILALRPVQVPMTESEINDLCRYLPFDLDVDDLPEPWAFKQGFRAAERAHGITAQAKKETP